MLSAIDIRPAAPTRPAELAAPGFYMSDLTAPGSARFADTAPPPDFADLINTMSAEPVDTSPPETPASPDPSVCMLPPLTLPTPPRTDTAPGVAALTDPVSPRVAAKVDAGFALQPAQNKSVAAKADAGFALQPAQPAPANLSDPHLVSQTPPDGLSPLIPEIIRVDTILPETAAINTGPLMAGSPEIAAPVAAPPASALSGLAAAPLPEGARAPNPVLPPAELPALLTAKEIKPGDERIIIQLDPPELGRVAIDFKFDGGVLQHVTVTGDTPEALRQLRALHGDLLLALERQGLGGSALSYQQAGGEGRADTRRDPPAQTTSQAPPPPQPPAHPVSHNPRPDLPPGSGLDIRL
jgi:Flagellar hook-length control protein FliK